MRLNQRMWIAFFAAGVVTFSCGFTSLRAQSPAGQDTQQTEAVLEPVDEIMAQDSAATFAVPVVPSAQIHPAGTESQSSSAPAKSRKELKKEAKQMAKAQRKGLIARPDPTVQRYRVEGGVKHQAYRPLRSEIVTVYSTADSLEADSMGITLVQLDSIRYNDRLYADSLEADSLGISLFELMRYRELKVQDSLRAERQRADSIMADSMGWNLSRRERRERERAAWEADTTNVRINRIFRDSIPISRTTMYSMVLPGFSQLYNSQAYKIPILYGLLGTATYFWQKEQKDYRATKREYDNLTSMLDPQNDPYYRDKVDPVHERLVKQNTRRQLWMAAAIGTYIYFLGDGAINYPGELTSIKKATTLSTIFPGAGQFYNKSYWKVPIVMGGFATMIMVIDWNNRGYQRYRTAYRLRTDGDPLTKDEYELRGVNVTAEQLLNYRTNFRRNRDLAIILTGLVYALNVIDAHVDAHMKTYDISDDLAIDMKLVPSVSNFTTTARSTNTFGFSLRFTF